MMKIKTILLPFVLLFVLFSCQNRSGDKKPADTPTTGEVSICVDETFKPIADAEIQVFQGLYQYAKVNPIYKSETEALNLLIKEKTHMVIISRPLKANEIDYFHSKKLYPTVTKIAVDAVALIINPSNRDSILSMNNIFDIVTGKVNKWKQIFPHSRLGNIKVVFDNPNSSTVRFVLDSISKNIPLSKHLSAMEYNKDVVQYVSQTPNAIGFIGVSWVSNKSDSTSLSFLKKVRVMALTKEKTATSANTYQPYQAYISKGYYPLTRNIYAINSDPHIGLIHGFVSFLASDRGQRIILKAGILPATQPVRIIEVNDNY